MRPVCLNIRSRPAPSSQANPKACLPRLIVTRAIASSRLRLGPLPSKLTNPKTPHMSVTPTLPASWQSGHHQEPPHGSTRIRRVSASRFQDRPPVLADLAKRAAAEVELGEADQRCAAAVGLVAGELARI